MIVIRVIGAALMLFFPAVLALGYILLGVVTAKSLIRGGPYTQEEDWAHVLFGVGSCILIPVLGMVLLEVARV